MTKPLTFVTNSTGKIFMVTEIQPSKRATIYKLLDIHTFHSFICREKAFQQIYTEVKGKLSVRFELQDNTEKVNKMVDNASPID